MQNFTYFSVFSGIGGFELGIKRCTTHHRIYREKTARCQDLSRSRDILLPDNGSVWSHCVGFSEISPTARHIYQRHFSDHPDWGDIRTLDPYQLPDFDWLCGGFPCQSFSVAGNQRGLDDERGALFFDMARIIEVKQPKILLLENVRGFLSHDQGHTALTCFATLNDLGYDLGWQVLNSKDFGLPQNRERMYLIGHLRDQPRPEVFPFTHTAATPNPDVAARVAGTTGIHRLRRLTPRECERVQGFPDNWTEGVSDRQRYMALGNAVSPPVVEAICRRLLRPSK